MFEQNLPPEKWFTAPAIAAAAITSVFTIMGIALKDYVFKTLEEQRTERRTRNAIYERYSNPLLHSTISLMNRLNEILFEKHRPVYLMGEGINQNPNPGGSYRAYKKLSSIYRLAVVLGWIRACRREFSYLRVADPGDAFGVDEAIGNLEDALADGQWVEQERVKRLCELWHLCQAAQIEKLDFSELGVRVDNVVWDHLEQAKVDDVSLLNEASRLTLCKNVAGCLSSHLNTNTVTEASLDRTWPDAMNVIGVREAWLYRDWQSAIGDVMIQPSHSDSRKFEVIGFGDFEQIVLEGSRTQTLAFTRLLNVFDDLNLTIEDRFDARPRQLRGIAKASAKLVLAIHAIQGSESIVASRVIERAQTLVAMQVS
jgi:hypothetical protein